MFDCLISAFVRPIYRRVPQLNLVRLPRCIAFISSSVPKGSSVGIAPSSLDFFVGVGDLENRPQLGPSVTGFGENPCQGAALRMVVVLYLPLALVGVAARRGCIFVYRDRPSIPPPKMVGRVAILTTPVLVGVIPPASLVGSLGPPALLTMDSSSH